MSNYGVFSGTFSPVFRQSKYPHSVHIQENTDHKKLRIRILQCKDISSKCQIMPSFLYSDHLSFTLPFMRLLLNLLLIIRNPTPRFRISTDMQINLDPSACFLYKRKAKKRPWNTSNTLLKKFTQIEGIF